MCHQSCLVFGKAHLRKSDIEGVTILEVGSRNINGSLRSYVESHKPARYVGTDIEHGRGVDVICDAVDSVEQFGPESFDVVICTSMLEHAKDWKATVSNLKRILKPGGILLLTTQSPGFSYHNPPDYWRFTLADMRAIFADLDIETLKPDPQVPGVFVKARRPRDFTERDLFDYRVREVEKPELTSIIIPVHNLWDITQRCLDSIACCTYMPYEIILVDNGSTDEMPEQLLDSEKHPYLHVVVNNDNCSYAVACNQGLAQAEGTYIVFLNNDTVVTDQWLMRMLAVFRRNPSAGIVGPMSNCVMAAQSVKDVPYKEDLVELPAFAARHYAENMSLSTEVPYLVGFCLLAKREVMDKVGSFDEAFSNAYEEIDFCYRAREAGYKCHIAEDVFIHHWGSATFRLLGSKEDYRANIDAHQGLFEDRWGSWGSDPPILIEPLLLQEAPVDKAPKYLITGTGRCGSRFMAKVFASAGVPCGHEAIFSAGGLAEAYGRVKGTPAESSWMAAPYLDNPLLENATIVHLVRHPKHVIQSWKIFADDDKPANQEYADLAYRTLPDLRKCDDQFDRAAMFYVRWNQMIERLVGDRLIRWRVEDDPQGLMDKLGIDTEGRRLYSNVREHTYAAPTAGALVKFELDKVSSPEIRAELLGMCERYGYDFDDPPLPPPQVYWAVLVERVIHNHALTGLLDVAMAAGALGYLRIGTLYSRTDAVRNMIVRMFRQLSRNPDDTIVMLDCDHVHPADAIERLAARQEGVVAALAFRRGPNFEPMFFVRHEDGRLLKPATFERKVYECDAVGHAAIAIKRWVFDKIQEDQNVNYFWRYTYTDTDWTSSEDMHFCKLCEDSGIKVHCDCSLETPHLRMEHVDSSVWFKHRGAHPELMREIVSES